MRRTIPWKPRHLVLSILSIAWVLSFVDRMAMSVAIPYIANDFHLSPLAMGAVLSAFYASYALSQIPGGLLADKFGVRRVVTIAMLWWSIATVFTGAAANLTQMLIARFGFGLGEGLYPGCGFKTIAVWFPKKERTTANALVFAAGDLGSALAPLIVGSIIAIWNWRTVFYVLFLPGVLIAMLFWKFVPDSPPESEFQAPEYATELDANAVNVTSQTDVKPSFLSILRHPNILKYFLVLFTFDIGYWGFASWLPTYLVKARGFTVAQMGLAASAPFFAGMIGGILGGWMSDKYFSTNRRRPIIATQLATAILLYLTFTTRNAALVVLFQALTGFFISFLTSAFWALPMNTIPKKLMGGAGGLINMGGQLAAFISPLVIGALVGASGGNYDLSFIFLIVALLASCAIAFTLPSQLQNLEDEG